MQYRSLGASGLKVPILSFGTATFGGSNEFFKAWGETRVTEAKGLIDICLDRGVNMFDSSDAYSAGFAEEILGKALKGRRDKVLISTKAAFSTGDGINDVGTSRHHLIAACEASLRRLNTAHIDIWQMHAFDAQTPVEETLRALEDLVREGKIRYIGCSNYSGWHLMKSLSISEKYGWSRYIAHQAYYSLASRDFEWELMPLAIDQNVGTLVWSPLSGGRLSGKINRNTTAPSTSRYAKQGSFDYDISEHQLYSIVDVMEDIAGEIGCTISQVALNWVLRRPTVCSVIIGARNREQLIENIDALNFSLNDSHMRRLDTVSETPAAYPYWHQRRTYWDRNPRVV